MRSKVVFKRETASLLAAMFMLASVVSGCAANVESQLIGKWETQLVGYNTTAQSVTNYTQTVTFAEDGALTLDTTLPGAVNHVTGTYEIVNTKEGPTLSITWDMAVDQPTTLFFAFDDGKLLTSPSKGGLAKPQNLNVTNADPVVYTRATGE